jgi:hypothetical protein
VAGCKGRETYPVIEREREREKERERTAREEHHFLG